MPKLFLMLLKMKQKDYHLPIMLKSIEVFLQLESLSSFLPFENQHHTTFIFLECKTIKITQRLIAGNQVGWVQIFTSPSILPDPITQSHLQLYSHKHATTSLLLVPLSPGGWHRSVLQNFIPLTNCSIPDPTSIRHCLETYHSIGQGTIVLYLSLLSFKSSFLALYQTTCCSLTFYLPSSLDNHSDLFLQPPWLILFFLPQTLAGILWDATTKTAREASGPEK